MKSEHFDHRTVDKKWQEKWEQAGIFHAQEGSSKPKQYVLVEFPYPSGAGLHVGHPRSYTALDVVARKSRMEGKNVLFPMGWDAFGLPAENYAIKTGVHPAITTKENIATFRRQLQSIGFSFDWSREVDTTDPKYYRWTQWMFLEFFKAGLAYKAKMFINWCPKDKVGLANEEVVGGACERCGTPVEKREKEQWMIAITKYADRLLKDLDTVDYLPKIKKQQEEWIGRSEGAEIDFAITSKSGHPEAAGSKVTVFTTRPDTLFGVTYIVLAPEHPLVEKITAKERLPAVRTYIAQASRKTEADRGDATKTKSGVFTGAYAVNPANGEVVPIWVADYVLANYGTGAVMAVPAHDERDHEFAKEFELPVKRVIEPKFVVTEGDAAVKQGEPFVKRDAVAAIIKNPKDGKYLCISWKTVHMHGLITGGIEEGEDPAQAALREIHEETGYKNVRFVKNPDVAIHTMFYHRVKKVNRWARFQYVMFELENEERDVVEDKEAAQHEVVWKTKEEMKNFFSVVEGTYALNVIDHSDHIYTGEGILVNSGEFDGQDSQKALENIVVKTHGRKVVRYKLRDWVFSRQRYWGEPIPLVHCESGCSPETKGWVAVPEKDLPVKLPEVEKYQPTDNGESPLANISEFVNTTCPTCGGKAKRETDTMPQWAGSSWYFLRYTDPHNDEVFASKEALKNWMPVDIYNGGMEHTTLHLLYSRFWNKFLFDRGHVPYSEPYARRHSHGLIMAEDGAKMSKSKGNVVNPDDIVKEFGADTLRMYELFMGPFEEPVPWSTNGVIGVRRFVEKMQRYVENWVEKPGTGEDPATAKLIEKAIKKVSDDIVNFSFNTAISALMILFNDLAKSGAPSKAQLERVLRIVVPFAPHLANELWEKIGNSGFVEAQEWPIANEKLLVEVSAQIAVQINGKVRGKLTVKTGATQDEVMKLAEADASVAAHLAGKKIAKIVLVPNRLLSIVLE